jgi:hypothetical protein
MEKLTQTHLASRDTLVAALNETYEALEDAVSEYNTTLAEAWNEVLSAEEAYNAAVGEAQEWLKDRAAEIQAYIDERSEQWQDSDRGKAYGEWKETFDLSLDDSDLDEPDELHVQVDNHADTLSALPEALGD